MSDKVTTIVKEVKKMGENAGLVLIENGRKITVPSHVKEGDEIVIKTEDESYLTKTSNT